MKITAYSDSDWANSKDHARSISGYAVYFGSSLFAWSVKKQTSTALSTGEAELYAGTHVGGEIMWMRSLLFELGLHTPGPTTLLIDNTSTTKFHLERNTFTLHTGGSVKPSQSAASHCLMFRLRTMLRTCSQRRWLFRDTRNWSRCWEWHLVRTLVEGEC